MAKTNLDEKQINLLLPTKLKEEIELQAGRLGLSTNAYIRLAITERVQRDEQNNLETLKQQLKELYAQRYNTNK